MKKALAFLFLFLLPVSLCHAADPLSVCFDAEGNTIHCADGKPLPKLEYLDFDNGFAGRETGIQKDSIPTLTFARLAEDPFTPSEIIKETQVITVPAPLKFQEPFISLRQDARKQEYWPWRDVIEAGPKKLHYNFNLEDATGRGSVRVFNAKIGIEYEVSKNTAIGMEGIRGIQDSQDASAWGKPAKEEKAAHVKYKIFF